jgi:DNA repair protein RadC
MKYNIPTLEVKLVRTAVEGYKPFSIKVPQDVFEFLGFLKESDREQFIALHLDAKHNVIGLNVVSIGTLSASLVHPREVFKAAILNNSHSILVAHNHPSGNPTPSLEDIQTTEILIKAGKLLGITVVDHVVVGDSLHSIRESNTELWEN